MVHCCIPGCKNTHHHKNKKEEWQMDTRNYSLHDLPGEDRMEVRELWVMAINRSTLPKDVAVCSDHFTEDCFDEKWEEYKRKYGPTKVKRKLKLDAVPTLFPGRIFMHEKVQQIRENWKNKVLQKRLEYERLRVEKEYRDRFKYTQTECQCKCRCKLRKKNFSQQVNFQFKFMEDVGVQFPKDLTETVKDDHSYTQGGKKKTKLSAQANTAAKSLSSNVSLALSKPSISVGPIGDLPLDLPVNRPIHMLPPEDPTLDTGAILDFSIKRKADDDSLTDDLISPEKKSCMEDEAFILNHKSIAVSTD